MKKYKVYFWVAFYNNGTMRLFNTKYKPKPMNINNGGELICVKKFTKTIP